MPKKLKFSERKKSFQNTARNVFAAYYYRAQGCSQTEIARKLGVSQRTVSRLLKRGEKYLHSEFAERVSRHGLRRLLIEKVLKEKAGGLTLSQIAERHGKSRVAIIALLREAKKTPGIPEKLLLQAESMRGLRKPVAYKGAEMFKAVGLAQKGWTQTRIARELGVSQKTVSVWLKKASKRFHPEFKKQFKKKKKNKKN